MAIAARHELGGVLLTLPAFAIAALAFARVRRDADAQHAVDIASEMIERLGRLSPRTRLLCNLVLAQAALASGDRATARQRASCRRGRPTHRRHGHATERRARRAGSSAGYRAGLPRLRPPAEPGRTARPHVPAHAPVASRDRGPPRREPQHREDALGVDLPQARGRNPQRSRRAWRDRWASCPSCTLPPSRQRRTNTCMTNRRALRIHQGMTDARGSRRSVGQVRGSRSGRRSRSSDGSERLGEPDRQPDESTDGIPRSEPPLPHDLARQRRALTDAPVDHDDDRDEEQGAERRGHR